MTEEVFIQKKTFEKINFCEEPLAKGDYEDCTFSNCDFSYADAGGVNFSDCTFTGCNLSMVKLANATLKDASFKDCKMLGIHFEACNQFIFSIGLDGCIADHCSFYNTKLKKTAFRNSRFVEADFTGCDLSGSVFDNCDLSGTKFENTNLEKADLRTSYNYSLDPDLNRMKKAKFSLTGIAGLLGKYDIEIE